MGVPGLWEVIQEVGRSHSLAHLAVVEGFEGNSSARRASRIGFDASIWYFHAENSTDAGANPELRMLFFRLCYISRMPILPLFVFDGRMRPKVKRGNKYGKSGSHWLTKDFKEMLDCFGMEWREAIGEAEAELAYLNASGFIDGIVTDDVDALLFGAKRVIRNMSLTLTGNKNNQAQDSTGKPSKHHVRIFEADAIQSRRDLSRGGMILFALICGGDYDNGKGVRNFGPAVAIGLARCGLGDRLLSLYWQGPARLQDNLRAWKAEVNEELRTNSHGYLPGRRDVSLPQNFPDIEILENYINPLCSARNGQHGGLNMRDRGNINLARIAAFCEQRFDEWGHKSAILTRFRNNVWEGAVMHVLRRAALEVDEKERSRRIQRSETTTIIGPLQPSPHDAVGTPASLVKRYLNPAVQDRIADAFVNRDEPAPAPFPMAAADFDPLITEITRSRESVHTDKLLEYRVLVNPKQLVAMASSGITGKHPEPASQASQGTPSSQGTAKNPVDPAEPLLMWIPASIMRQVHPKLVEEFLAGKNKSPKKPARKGKGRALAEEPGDTDVDEDDPIPAHLFTGAVAQPSPSKPRANAGTLPTVNAAPGPSRLPKPIVKPLENHRRDQQVPKNRRSESPVHAPSASQPAPLARHHAPKVQPMPLPMSQPNPVVQPFPLTQSVPGQAYPPNQPVYPGHPVPLRGPSMFYNVGLIETEEPASASAFLFTFTNPDDPDHLFIDDDDEPFTHAVGPAPQLQQPQLPIPQPPPQQVPAALPQLQTMHTPSSSQQQHASPMRARRSSPPAANATSTQRQARQPLSVPETPVNAQPVPPSQIDEDWEMLRGTTTASGSLSQYDGMFDQILGIVPGAKKRPKATKRSRATALAGIQVEPTPTDSQPAKRRRTDVDVPFASQSQPGGTGAVSSTRNPAPSSHVPAVTLPPLAGGTQPRPRPRPRVHREADVVLLSSDDEDPSKAVKAAPARLRNSQATSSQESRLDSDSFFSDVDRFVRLS